MVTTGPARTSPFLYTLAVVRRITTLLTYEVRFRELRVDGALMVHFEHGLVETGLTAALSGTAFCGTGNGATAPLSTGDRSSKPPGGVNFHRPLKESAERRRLRLLEA